MTKRFIKVNLLVNRDDFPDLGDFVLEESFDTHFEGHFCAGAAGAGALKADLYRFAVFGGNEFDVTPVALKVRPYGIDYHFNLLLKGIRSFAVAAALFAHSWSPFRYS